MIKNDDSKIYWEKLALNQKDVLLCSRALLEDTPEPIQKYVLNFEKEVSKFSFDGSLGKILDAGCGTSNLYVHCYKKLLKSDISYIGLDLSINMLIRGLNQTIDLNVNFCQATVARLPFKDFTFDRIICSGVLNYLENKDVERTIKDFFRTLKPEGILIIDFHPNAFSPKIFLRSYLNKVFKIFKTDRYRYNFYVFKNLLIKSGFEIIAVKGFDFRPLSGNQSYKTPLRYLNPFYIQETFSASLEGMQERIPFISIFACRIYFKCKKNDF